jgi:tetrahydromethanopterin S-methyltransferase subunit E
VTPIYIDILWFISTSLISGYLFKRKLGVDKTKATVVVAIISLIMFKSGWRTVITSPGGDIQGAIFAGFVFGAIALLVSWVAYLKIEKSNKQD